MTAARVTLEPLRLDRVPWDDLDRCTDRTVFQTRGWLSFLEDSQHARPVVAAVHRRGEHVGWFTGAVVRKLGFKILGSPLRGWTTSYMGFNLRDGVDLDVDAALGAVRTLAFRELGCVHVEIMDRRFAPTSGATARFLASPIYGYEVDLRPPPDKILARMNQARRHAIRRAPRNGVTVEQARGLEFADEHYAQLGDVFAKQGLPPPYGIERIRSLIRHVEPTGNLLLVRARDPEGRSIATGVFPGFGRSAYFWMGASWRASQKLLPNEAIQWFAINYWRDRGAVTYDMGGGGDYKSKYGTTDITVTWLRSSRFAGMDRVRSELLDLRKRVRRLQGRVRNLL